MFRPDGLLFARATASRSTRVLRDLISQPVEVVATPTVRAVSSSATWSLQAGDLGCVTLGLHVRYAVLYSARQELDSTTPSVPVLS